MLYLLFLASTLFANTDYYAIEAGDILETYGVCYVALDYGDVEPELRKLKCSDNFDLTQNYYQDENKLSLSWKFDLPVSRTREKNMGYGEFTTVVEKYTLSDSDVCYLKVDDRISWIVDSGIFGCGMTKLFKPEVKTPEFNIWNEIIINK